MNIISNRRVHMETLRGQTADDMVESDHFEQFVDWYREYVRICLLTHPHDE